MIRSATPSDAPAMYEICLRTGDAGADATHLFADAQLLGDVYVGPYLACRPAFALVAEDGPGTGVLGYVVGTPDTARFSAACEAGWWPGLRARHPIDRDGHGRAGCAPTAGRAGPRGIRPLPARSPTRSSSRRSRRTSTSTFCPRRRVAVWAAP